MSTVAIGDVHGNVAALCDLLRQLENEVSAEDVVVFLGDYIDRGADSRGCIDRILSFRAETPADVVCLRGNHEDWLLRTKADYTRHSWLVGMEGFETIGSYSREAERALRDALRAAGLRAYQDGCALPYDVFFDAVPPAHQAFFERLAVYVENNDCICTHAGLDPSVSRVADQLPQSLIWGNPSFPDEYVGERTVVYGHWNNAVSDGSGWPSPRICGTTIGIDTISYGVLTAVRLPDKRVFQSARHLPAASSI